MPLLQLFGAWLVLIGLLVVAGLVAERPARVRAARHRIEGLAPPLHGRLGVWIARDRRVPMPVRLLPITAFVYGVAPLDLLPDILPGVGRLDDRAVLAIALWAVTTAAPGPFEEHLSRVEFLRDAAAARSDVAADDFADDPTPEDVAGA